MKKKARKPDEFVAQKAEVSSEVKEALDTIEEISRVIEEDIDERSKDRGADYLESTEDRAKSIGETIERTQRVTEPQLKALNNMLERVRKWVHDD